MTYQANLQSQGLHIVEVASTPEARGAAQDKTNPQTNTVLADALKIYRKHYLKAEDGIPGEGEKIADVLSRLRGEDPNVPRMTVLGVADDGGKLHGVAFIETYKLTTEAGKEGASHLVTYAAMENKYKDKLPVNAAFHQGIVEATTKIDRDFGIAPGGSVIVAEVNAALDYQGNRTSNKMNPEFEIKTGSSRENREVYQLGGDPRLITIAGDHSPTHIVQNTYIPPNLAEEKLPDGIKTAADLAPHLRNQDVLQGKGEPLFLVAKSAYRDNLAPDDVALLKAHKEALMVSVAHGNYGIQGVTDNPALVREAISKVPEFQAENAGLDTIARQQAGNASVVRDQKTAADPQSPAQQLRDAVAANDVTAMLTAIAAGAALTPAFIKLAATNPQLLAALPPGMADAITNQQTQEKSNTNVRPPAMDAPAPSLDTKPVQPKGANTQPKGMHTALIDAGRKLKPTQITDGGSAGVAAAQGVIKGEDGKPLGTPPKRGGRG